MPVENQAKVNIAIVGCGYWGGNLVRVFGELGFLYAVCDPNVDLASKYSEHYGAACLTFDEVVNDDKVEGVVLAVPAPLHAQMAIAALNAGKHVFVEKPLAMTQIEAERMMRASEKNNVHLMVGHLLQYHAAFRKVCEMVAADKIGALQYLYSNRLSHGKLRHEEDVIWSFAPHDISMILTIAGQEPDSVKTEKVTILQEGIADSATLHLQFPSGLRAHVSVSWLHPFKEQRLVVIGSTGMIVFDDTKPWSQKCALYRHSTIFTDQQPSLVSGEQEYVQVPQSEPLQNECQHFADVVSGGERPLTNAAEGLRVLRVLEATAS